MSARPMPRATGQMFAGVLVRAGQRAVQIRLLVLWLLAMALPTALLALPLYAMLGRELNYSPAAAALASQMSFGALVDLIDAPSITWSALSAISIAPVIAMLVISPWFSALALAAARRSERLSFRALIDGSNAAYWSMVRIGLFGLAPLLGALLLAKIAASAVDRYDAHAVLESSVEHRLLAARLFALIMVALAHCSVEIGRAVLVAHPRRRSVLRAWWVGLGMLRRHPARLFGTWLLVTLPVMVLVTLLMVLRTNLDQGSSTGLCLALLLAEACIACLAWMRCTRLFALVDLVAQITADR